MTVVGGVGDDLLVRLQRLQQQMDGMQKTLDTQNDTIRRQNETIQTVSASRGITGTTSEKAEKAEKNANDQAIPAEKQKLQVLKKVKKLTQSLQALKQAKKLTSQEYFDELERIKKEQDALIDAIDQATPAEKQSLQALKIVKKLTRQEYFDELEKIKKEQDALISDITLDFLTVTSLFDAVAIPGAEARRATMERSAKLKVLERLANTSPSQIPFILQQLKKLNVVPQDYIGFISTILVLSNKAERALKRQNIEGIKKIEGFSEITRNHEEYVLHYLNQKIQKLPNILLKDGLEYVNKLWSLAQKIQVNVYNKETQSAFRQVIEIYISVTKCEIAAIIGFYNILVKCDPKPRSDKVLYAAKAEITTPLSEYFLKGTFGKETCLKGLNHFANGMKSTYSFYDPLLIALKSMYKDDTEKMGLITSMEKIVQNMPKVKPILASKSLTTFSKIVGEMDDVEKAFYSLQEPHPNKEYIALKKLFDLAETVSTHFSQESDLQPVLEQLALVEYAELEMILQYIREKKVVSDQRYDAFVSLVKKDFILRNIDLYLKLRKTKEALIIKKTGAIEGLSHNEDRPIRNIAERDRLAQETRELESQLAAANKDLAALNSEPVLDKLKKALHGERASELYLVHRGSTHVSSSDTFLLEELEQELQFALSGDSRTTHFKKVFCDFTVANRPEKVTIDSLLPLFNKINFPANENKAALRTTLERFIKQVKTRAHITATPRDPEERRKFYETMEVPLFHVIQTLEKEKENDKLVEAMRDLIKAADYCGTMQLFNCFDLYRKVVLKLPVDLKSMLYTSLGQLRELFLRDLVPPRNQSIHYFMTVLRKLGPELGIPGATRYRNYKDEYENIGGAVNVDQVRADFMGVYTVPEIIKDCKMKLGKKGFQEFREAFIEWHVKQMPADFCEEDVSILPYNGLEEEVGIKISEGMELAQIKQFLQRHPEAPVQVREEEEIQNAILRTKEDERRALYVRKEVYEDMYAWKVKPAALYKMLLAFEVLKQK